MTCSTTTHTNLQPSNTLKPETQTTLKKTGPSSTLRPFFRFRFGQSKATEEEANCTVMFVFFVLGKGHTVSNSMESRKKNERKGTKERRSGGGGDGGVGQPLLADDRLDDERPVAAQAVDEEAKVAPVGVGAVAVAQRQADAELGAARPLLLLRRRHGGHGGAAHGERPVGAPVAQRRASARGQPQSDGPLPVGERHGRLDATQRGHNPVTARPLSASVHQTRFPWQPFSNQSLLLFPTDHLHICFYLFHH